MTDVAYKELAIVLPWPPSINDYYMPVRRGRSLGVIKGPRVRAYRQAAHVAWAACRPAWHTSPLESRLAVDIVWCPPTRRKHDVDNGLKGLLDAMEHCGVYANDEQIDDLRVRRGDVAKNGRAEVRIAEIIKTIPR